MLERGAAPELVFEGHRASARAFWARFGGRPDVHGKRILDFGCGTGGMIQDVMEAGAASAVGVELSQRAFDHASRRLTQEWGDRVDVRLADIRGETFEPVDLIVSQNTLEHVTPLDETLLAVVDKVRPGGEVYFGFSPLWYSPYGSHRYPPTNIPWYHVMFGDQVVIDAHRKQANVELGSIYEAFNKATPRDFRRAIGALPVDVISFRTNVTNGAGKQLGMNAFRLLSKLPGLEKYFTIGMYVHLRKRRAA